MSPGAHQAVGRGAVRRGSGKSRGQRGHCKLTKAGRHGFRPHWCGGGGGGGDGLRAVGVQRLHQASLKM